MANEDLKGGAREVERAGFITQAKLLRSHGSEELEDRLGYRRGRMAPGWWLLFLLELPGVDDFQVRGYSHMSGGVPEGHKAAPPDPRHAEQRLGDEGYDVRRIKQGLIDGKFTLVGPDRLAKVVPLADEFGRDDYPAGSRIPQWTLTKAMPFSVAEFVARGQVYRGAYT